MAKSKEINMKLPALDDLFSTQEERDEVSRESVRIYIEIQGRTLFEEGWSEIDHETGEIRFREQ